MVMTFVETAEVESSEFVEDWGAEAASELMGESSELISQRGFSSREIDPRRSPQAVSRLKSLAGVSGKPLEWVWDRVVPRGKLTLPPTRSRRPRHRLYDLASRLSSTGLRH